MDHTGAPPEPGVLLPKWKTGWPAPVDERASQRVPCGALCQILQESSVPRLRWSTGGPELLTADARFPPRVGWRLALWKPSSPGALPSGRQTWKKTLAQLAPLLRGERGVACLCAFAGPLSGTAVRVGGKAVGTPVAGPSPLQDPPMRCAALQSPGALHYPFFFNCTVRSGIETFLGTQRLV